MEMAIETLPGLERLMRDVLRHLLEDRRGKEWLNSLSGSVTKSLQGTFQVVARQRPELPPSDIWASAGFREIRDLIASEWPDLQGALSPVWTSREESQVDLQRLLTHRGRAFHDVGPTNFHEQQLELSAMATRLRLGFEAVRRSLLDDDSDWMVYLERIDCSVPELSWSRGDLINTDQVVVYEGDLILFRLHGVNPAGSQDALNYWIEVTGTLAPVELIEVGPSEFQFEVPRGKQILVGCYVRNRADPVLYDGWTVSAKVISRRPS